MGIGKMPKIFWADFKFPPINLWCYPRQYKDWMKSMSDAASEDWFENEYLRNQKEGRREDSITLDVIADLKQREKFGALKYGKFLTHHTTEDTMQHLYEELLDATLYIKTEMKKRKYEQSAKVSK